MTLPLIKDTKPYGLNYLSILPDAGHLALERLVQLDQKDGSGLSCQELLTIAPTRLIIGSYARYCLMAQESYNDIDAIVFLDNPQKIIEGLTSYCDTPSTFKQKMDATIKCQAKQKKWPIIAAEIESAMRVWILLHTLPQGRYSDQELLQKLSDCARHFIAQPKIGYAYSIAHLHNGSLPFDQCDLYVQFSFCIAGKIFELSCRQSLSDLGFGCFDSLHALGLLQEDSSTWRAVVSQIPRISPSKQIIPHTPLEEHQLLLKKKEFIVPDNSLLASYINPVSSPAAPIFLTWCSQISTGWVPHQPITSPLQILWQCCRHLLKGSPKSAEEWLKNFQDCLDSHHVNTETLWHLLLLSIWIEYYPEECAQFKETIYNERSLDCLYQNILTREVIDQALSFCTSTPFREFLFQSVHQSSESFAKGSSPWNLFTQSFSGYVPPASVTSSDLRTFFERYASHQIVETLAHETPPQNLEAAQRLLSTFKTTPESFKKNFWWLIAKLEQNPTCHTLQLLQDLPRGSATSIEQRMTLMKLLPSTLKRLEDSKRGLAFPKQLLGTLIHLLPSNDHSCLSAAFYSPTVQKTSSRKSDRENRLCNFYWHLFHSSEPQLSQLGYEQLQSNLSSDTVDANLRLESLALQLSQFDASATELAFKLAQHTPSLTLSPSLYLQLFGHWRTLKENKPPLFLTQCHIFTPSFITFTTLQNWASQWSIQDEEIPLEQLFKAYFSQNRALLKEDLLTTASCDAPLRPAISSKIKQFIMEDFQSQPTSQSDTGLLNQLHELMSKYLPDDAQLLLQWKCLASLTCHHPLPEIPSHNLQEPFFLKSILYSASRHPLTDEHLTALCCFKHASFWNDEERCLLQCIEWRLESTFTPPHPRFIESSSLLLPLLKETLRSWQQKSWTDLGEIARVTTILTAIGPHLLVDEEASACLLRVIHQLLLTAKRCGHCTLQTHLNQLITSIKGSLSATVLDAYLLESTTILHTSYRDNADALAILFTYNSRIKEILPLWKCRFLVHLLDCTPSISSKKEQRQHGQLLEQWHNELVKTVPSFLESLSTAPPSIQTPLLMRLLTHLFQLKVQSCPPDLTSFIEECASEWLLLLGPSLKNVSELCNITSLVLQNTSVVSHPLHFIRAIYAFIVEALSTEDFVKQVAPALIASLYYCAAKILTPPNESAHKCLQEIFDFWQTIQRRFGATEPWMHSLEPQMVYMWWETGHSCLSATYNSHKCSLQEFKERLFEMFNNSGVALREIHIREWLASIIQYLPNQGPSTTAHQLGMHIFNILYAYATEHKHPYTPGFFTSCIDRCNLITSGIWRNANYSINFFIGMYHAAWQKKSFATQPNMWIFAINALWSNYCHMRQHVPQTFPLTPATRSMLDELAENYPSECKKEEWMDILILQLVPFLQVTPQLSHIHDLTLLSKHLYISYGDAVDRHLPFLAQSLEEKDFLFLKKCLEKLIEPKKIS